MSISLPSNSLCDFIVVTPQDSIKDFISFSAYEPAEDEFKQPQERTAPVTTSLDVITL